MAEVVQRVLNPVLSVFLSVTGKVNDICKDREPWKVIVLSCGATAAFFLIRDFVNQPESLKTRLTRSFFHYVKLIPQVRRKIDEEINETSKFMLESLCKANAGSQFVECLPKDGLTEEKLTEALTSYQKLDSNKWKEGYVSGAVYNGNDKLTEIITMTYGMFAWTNPLHPAIFPDVRKMEAEVVRMTCSIFNGGPESCGSVTIGGTESILLACLAYRTMALERGVRIPEIIVPITAHAAFDKAAYLFRMRITHIPVDPVTQRVNVAAMKRAIGGSTCMLVASAPGFPHGAMDPVEEVAALGRRYHIPVHVDCCLGGFLLPFMDKAGFPVKPFDFRVPGVTSISADTHKYGFAPKGSSVLMFKNTALRKHQFFSQVNWPGGLYATPTLGGSRAGALIAACWAALMFTGENGYVESTRKIISTARYIVSELRKINEIEIIGEPDASVIAFASKEFNIYTLLDTLHAKGWSLNPLQFPPSIHLCVTMPQTAPGVAERFIADIKAAVKDIKLNPSPVKGSGAIYGMCQTIPDRSLVSDVTGIFIDATYNTRPYETLELLNGAIKNSK